MPVGVKAKLKAWMEISWNGCRKGRPKTPGREKELQVYGSVKHTLGILKNVLSDDDIVKGTGYLFVRAATKEGWSGFLRKHDPIVRVLNFSRESTRPGK